VDFYCPECRLAVELDGEGHFNSVKTESDAQRTAFLRKFNVRVIRFENRMVFENLTGLLEGFAKCQQIVGSWLGKEKPYHPLTPS
jgi:very-short-patch-repair endonuclease